MCVYKGKLSSGQVVAVKWLDRNGLQGNREFLVEVLILSLLHDPDLVNLIGYCAKGEQRLPIYEFMPLGSLEDHLFGDKSHVSTRVMRTQGYRASEYAVTGQLTVKSDVYSFGVFFRTHRWMQSHRMQPPTRRTEPCVMGRNTEQSMFNDRRRFVKLTDPRLEGKFPSRGLYQALAVASICIQEQAAGGRPLIWDVVIALSYLANQPYDVSIAFGPSSRSAAEKDDNRSKDERGGTLLRSEEGGSGHKWNLEGFEREDSPREKNRDLERERAVAEAKMWGEN